MREFAGAVWLMLIQGCSLLMTAVGACWSSAGAMAHVVFVRQATKYDEKYAPDIEAPSVIPDPVVEEKKWSN